VTNSDVGLDFWLRNPDFSSRSEPGRSKEIDELRQRIAMLEGEKTLAALCKEGAELIATGVYTRHVVHKIEGKKSNRQL